MAGTMTTQRLHSQLAPIDILTREELQQEMHRGIDSAVRELERGKEIQRFPRTIVTALATTFQMFTGNDQTPVGPEQGDVWMVRRVIVKGFSLTDLARYILFRGSTPSDINSGYTGQYLLEGFSAPVTQPVPPAISVGASPFTFMNVQPYGVNVTVTGGTVSSITVNGQPTGATSGTFFLAPNSFITVTYTVAPTMTEVNATSNTPQGLNVNIGFYPGTKSIFLQPGEQIYAQVTNATINNQYILEGEAIRVPAEMKGKIL